MKKNLLREIIVWLIIFAGLVIFSLFAYIIASNRGNLLISLVNYKTILPESTGLYVGTKITIHGKNTGNIIKTTLRPDGKVEILFSVRKNHTFSITESSVTELKNSGALGDRFINILTQDLSAKKLKKGGLIPYQKSSSLLALLTGGGEAKKSIQSLIAKTDDLIYNINTGLLSSNHKENLTQILKSLKNILQKVESGQGTLGALIYDRSLYNRLLILLGERPSNKYLQDLSSQSQQQFKKQ